MDWIPLLLLPDGITVHMQLPTRSTCDSAALHRYRVREPDQLDVEFGTLPEVAAYLRRCCQADDFAELVDGAARASLSPNPL